MILAISIVAMSTLPVFLVGAAFVQLENDLGLTPTSLGVLTALFFMTAAISSTPLGHVVERIGWRRAMRINSAITAAVLVAIGAVGRSTLVLAVLLVIAGLTYGLANPAANRALAQRTDPARRGVVFGLKHAGIPTSTLLAGLAVPALVLTVGWPWTFAAGALLLPVIWLLIARDLDRQIDWAEADATEQPDGSLDFRQLAALGLAAAMGSWAAVSLGTFLVAAAVDSSVSEAAAGLLLFAGSVVSIGARAGYGVWTDRVRGGGFAGMAVLMAIGSVVFLGLRMSTGTAFILLVLLAFATAWGWPGLMTFTVVNANASTAAASSGVTQAGVFLGVGLGPIIIGWVITNVSFQASWLLVSAVLAGGAVTAAAVGRGVSHVDRSARGRPVTG